MTTATEGVPSTNEAFGLVVHEAMFRQRISQVKLAATLKCHPTTLGKKLAGERPWSLEDAVSVADALRLDLRDLLGLMWRDDPASAAFSGGGQQGNHRQTGSLSTEGPLAQSVELRTFNPKVERSGVTDLAGWKADHTTRRNEHVKSA